MQYNIYLSSRSFNTQVQRLSISYGLFVTLLLNFHGLLYLIGRVGIRDGGVMNPILAPTVTGLFLFIFLKSQLLRGFRLKKNEAVVLVITAGLIFVALYYGNKGTATKLMRDVIYTGLFCITSIVFARKINEKKIDVKTFVKTVYLLSGIVLPLFWMFFLGASTNGRLSGFQLSGTMFANLAVILVYLLYMGRLSFKWIITGCLLAAIFILQSGTRTAFALLTGFVLFMLLSWLRKNPKYALKVLIPSISIIAIIVLVNLNSIIDIFSAAPGDSPIARVVTTEDVEQGSIASRVFWVLLLWDRLIYSGWLGGFGAGQAESVLGVIPHFDFLRFWYDYSLVYLVLYIMLFVKSTRLIYTEIRNRIEFVGLSIIIYGSILAFTLHNILQDPAYVMTLSILLVLLPFRFQTEDDGFDTTNTNHELKI